MHLSSYAVTRPFHELALPKDLQVDGFAGFGQRAWLLSGDQVLEHDGSRIVGRHKLCGAKPIRRDGPRYSLLTTLSGVYAHGNLMSGEQVIAEIRPKSAAKCRTYVATTEPLFISLALLPTRFAFALPLDTRSILGAPFGYAEEGTPCGAVFFAPRHNSLWLQVVGCPPREFPTFHFDGRHWRRVPAPPVGYVRDIWQDPSGIVWAIKWSGPVLMNAGADRQYSTENLARYDGKWKEIFVPSWFLPDSITGTATDDVWFVARHQVFQWDGTRLRTENWAKDDPSRQPAATFTLPPFMDAAGSLWLVAQTPDGPKLLRTDPKSKR